MQISSNLNVAYIISDYLPPNEAKFSSSCNSLLFVKNAIFHVLPLNASSNPMQRFTITLKTRENVFGH